MASSAALTEEPEPQKLNRRRIYLHRLVGDDVHAPRAKSSRRTSWRVVLRFSVYAFIACFTISSRSNVWNLSVVNVGLKRLLARQAFTRSPNKYFEDIKTVDDVVLWVKQAVIQELQISDRYTRPLSYLGQNRVVSTFGTCPEDAAVIFTLRRVKTTADFAATTTDRFNQLYPRAWEADTLPAGSGPNDAEATDTMTSRLNETVRWVYTTRCEEFCEGIDYQHQGFRAQGGYVAVLTLSTDHMPYVHLVDNTAGVSVSSETGICGGIKMSAAVPVEEFLRSGFLDDQFGSLAIESTVYNPNLQLMSKIYVTFGASAAGLVTTKDIRVQSITLDIYDGMMRYFEVAYLVFTGCYFFEFCYRAYKYHPAFLFDIWSWVNFVSIVMSLTSLALWYVYMPLLEEFNQSADFEYPQEYDACFNFILWYMRSGSVATLTICLRFLKYMGDLNSRVRLLLRVLSISAAKIIVYVLYVSVIFLGFTAFAYIKFSAQSDRFVSPFMAFLSCFELFLGDVTSIESITESAMHVPFYLLFMVFFNFVCVQMFNAIINYAYNLMSEQMEPEIEQEQRERKRQELQRLNASKDFIHNLRGYILSLSGRSKSEDVSTTKDGGEADKNKGQHGGVDEKDKAMHRKGKEKRKMPDSVCRVILFFAFASFYMWFLVVNLAVEHSSEVKQAIDNSIYGTSIPDFSTYREVNGMAWNDIFTLTHAAHWLYGSLPQILFNTTSVQSKEAAIRYGLQDPDAVCLKSWNCLVTAPGLGGGALALSENTGGSNGAQAQNATDNSTTITSNSSVILNWPPNPVPRAPLWASPRNVSLVRITQRRIRIRPNTGCISSDTPTDSCFTGGLGNTSSGNVTNHARLLAPKRLPPLPIEVGQAPSDDELRDTGYSVTWKGRPVCESSTDKGFSRQGGIVCTLDADYGTFLNQLDLLFESNFVRHDSSSIVVDFATFNGNENMLTYATIEFTMQSSGAVWKRVSISSISLLDFHDFLDQWGIIISRILPGIMYICLVMKFAYDLHWDLRQEIYRKRLNENSSWIVAAMEFITLDVFNMLEAISIIISIFSFILYIMWLITEGDLKEQLQGDLNDFLDFCMDLTIQARLYNRLSAMNCLLIFVRPLKFVRQSVRFAQLYQTLWDARTDIGCFVFMFAIIMLGGVMFSFVSFGPFFIKCRSISRTLTFLFNYILGNFDFWPLWAADPLMAVIFFFPYLLVSSLVFLNIFFAIVDRYYAPKESPPLNLKRRLKPVFQRICRCIEWDEDYVMETDPNEEKKAGPPSRQSKVKDLVQTINCTAGESGQSFGPKSSRLINEVCDVDERMGDALHWSREEASKVISDFRRLLQKKQTVKNDEVFIKADVMKSIRDESKEVKEDMEESERLMRYATKVHEQIAMRDQETLAKYILILELKIRNRMKQRHELEREVRHLRSESDKMRYTHEELTQHAGVAQVRNSERWAGEDKDIGSDSDEEPTPAQAPAPEAGAGGPAAIEDQGPVGGGEGAEPESRSQRRQDKTNALLGLRG